MNRRMFLQILAALCLWVIGRRPVQPCLRFYVAGARFYGPPRAVERVSFRPSRFRDEPAIAVHGPDGRQLGWVPQPLVAEVASTGVSGGRVVAVEPDGLPWRWYRIEVS